MGLIKDLGIATATFSPYLNTGTMLDLANGAFVPGVDDHFILNGGLASTIGGAGKPQIYKSTQALSCMINALHIYPDSDGWVYDTENSQDAIRLAQFANNPLLQLTEPLGDRLIVSDRTAFDVREFFNKLKELCEHKHKMRNDITVETPFLDHKTMKRRLMLIPTIIAIDSWSKLYSSDQDELFEKADLGSSDTNMLYMKENKMKNQMLNQLVSMAAKFGIYFILTAHVGDKYDLTGGRSPASKDLQYMKATEKLKHVGSDFNFLVSTLVQYQKSNVHWQGNDPKAGNTFPHPDFNETDINLVDGVVVRCKNNNSGTKLTQVVSQKEGIHVALSNYDYLRRNDYFGLGTNKVTHKFAIYPEGPAIGRTTAREKLEDPRMARAAEILCHYHYISTNWSLNGVPVNFKMSIEEFAEKLTKSNSYAVDDVLASRGYWSYDKKSAAPYMSIYDIVALLCGKGRQEWLQVKLPEMSTSKKK